MTAKVQTPIPTPSELIPDFDTLEIINVNVVTHLQKLIESGFSGNIDIGDELKVDGSNNIIFETKLVIHYVLVLANVIVYQDVLELTDAEFTAAPTSTGFKNSLSALAFTLLKDANVIPQSAVIS